METKNINGDILARTISKAGIILIESGAETYRVEDTMYRLAKAYNVDTVDAYATPTLLIISFYINQQLFHNIKRVHLKNVNLSKIDAINQLSRQVCQQPLSLDILNNRLDEINNTQGYSTNTLLLGAGICCFGFSLFFKGNISDAIYCFFEAIIIQYCNIKFTSQYSSFLKYTLLGGLTTLIAYIGSYFNIINIDNVIISTIMLLVPGLAITNAIRDSVSGDLVSGLSRASEALFTAIAIALGSAIILIILGGIL